MYLLVVKSCDTDIDELICCDEYEDFYECLLACDEAIFNGYKAKIYKSI